MEYKLAFEWLSDPLLQYALYLSGFFILGIAGCIVLIAHKFQSHHSHQVKQAHIAVLIRELLDSEKPHQLQIDNVNQCIQKHPIDVCYAMVRVLENASPLVDIQIFKNIQIIEVINKSLTSLFHKNHAIAIEAIGLLKRDAYRTTLICHLDDPACCSFAAEALVRLDGASTLPIILPYYQRKFLTISQMLTILMKLNPHDLQELIAGNSSIVLPKVITRYLRTS